MTVQVKHLARVKGSVPGEKFRKFGNQNFVHCLVSMSSSMF